MWRGLSLRVAAVVFIVQLAGRPGVSCDRSKDITGGDSSSADESSDDDQFEDSGIHSLTDEEIIRTFPSLSLDEILPRLIQYGNTIFQRMEWNHAVLQMQREGNGFDADSPVSFGELLDAGTGPTSLSWIASVLHRERLITAVAEYLDSSSSEDDDSEDDEYEMHTFLTSGRPCREAFYKSDYSSVNADSFDTNEDPASKCIPRVTMLNFTAITASPFMRRDTLKTASRFGILSDPAKEILVGNWQDPGFLEGRKYDTILADYLLGAVDGFAPYFQDKMFGRLSQHLKPGGRLYISGLNPIPEELDGPGDVFCRITKVRDACIKLAGDRTYREYPLEWVIRQLERAGLLIVDIRKYPIKHEAQHMIMQINVARSKLSRFPSRDLAATMAELLDSYEDEVWEVTDDGPLTISFNYVIAAEMPSGSIQNKESSGSKDEL
mmetsp:Transcript_14146/g.32535  ORF Transcript_14146/g.32535 Transcript_14146/m.32535 type:complete len:437 (+) Transcript_14146:134-1444(+)